jgi:branched-chain amino acid transport system substrate-binding protein
MFLAANQEAIAVGKRLRDSDGGRKIAILDQNNDYGRDFLRGLKRGLGDKADIMIAREISNDVTSPTIDSQVVTLRSTEADIFITATTGRFATLAVRKISELR